MTKAKESEEKQGTCSCASSFRGERQAEESRGRKEAERRKESRAQGQISTSSHSPPMGSKQEAEEGES
jgi:hypothetical protein